MDEATDVVKLKALLDELSSSQLKIAQLEDALLKEKLRFTEVKVKMKDLLGGVYVRSVTDNTPRQTQVMEALIDELSDKHIAGLLHISVRTVKYHVSSLLKKYKCRSRHELAGIAGLEKAFGRVLGGRGILSRHGGCSDRVEVDSGIEGSGSSR